MAHRPTITGTRHMVSACHYLAAQAGSRVLDAGGNAIDAGVAAGMALAVVQPEYVNFAGVAPIIVRLKTGELTTISGLGGWPKALTPDYFATHHKGRIPRGVLRTVVPGAPDAWITALEKFGTMSFGEVSLGAIDLARNGFPVNPLMAELMASKEAQYREFPSCVSLYLPNGHTPRVGEIFVQADLANTLQYMVDEERAAAGKGREAGLDRARRAFYRGDIAQRIVRHQAENGGLLSAEDLADFRVGLEAPVHVAFGDIDLYGCGPWSQGPCLLQAVNLLKNDRLRDLGHNSADYLHRITEAIKLVFADREAWFGDPRHVDVPIDALLSDAYAQRRRSDIREAEAWPGMPPSGTAEDLGCAGARKPPAPAAAPAWRAPDLDTSYVCVVDRWGNTFSATPSDGSYNAPVVPGLGIIPSPRGSQSWADPKHPSAAAAGKRPRLTPNPAIAVGPEWVMPFGTPGGDVQTQAMLQVFFNIVVFGMEPQDAVEAPRCASYSFPSSFEPHEYHAGLLNLEGRIDRAAGESLAAWGHRVQWWPDWTWLAGSVCTIVADRGRGLLKGAADPRRPAYAIGW